MFIIYRCVLLDDKKYKFVSAKKVLELDDALFMKDEFLLIELCRCNREIR